MSVNSLTHSLSSRLSAGGRCTSWLTSGGCSSISLSLPLPGTDGPGGGRWADAVCEPRGGSACRGGRLRACVARARIHGASPARRSGGARSRVARHPVSGLESQFECEGLTQTCTEAKVQKHRMHLLTQAYRSEDLLTNVCIAFRCEHQVHREIVWSSRDTEKSLSPFLINLPLI